MKRVLSGLVGKGTLNPPRGRFGLLGRTMRPYYYLGGRRGMTQLSTGQLFIVNTEARDIATWIIHAGVWENFVDDILSALVRPGDTFLDVGANMGYYTVKIGGMVGEQGRVFSFEPNPSFFDVLSDNCHINGFDSRAKCFNAAAGETAGSSSLTFEPRYPGGGMVGLGAEYAVQGRLQVEVPVIVIDDVVEGKADLIKIDVEGFEPLVLRGMKNLLARSPDCALVVEVNFAIWSNYGDPAQMVQDIAGDRRIFRIYVDGKIEELPSGAIDRALNRDFVSYILFLPPTPQRYDQIRRFVRGYREPQAETAEPARPVPPRPPSLLRRIQARIARL